MYWWWWWLAVAVSYVGGWDLVWMWILESLATWACSPQALSSLAADAVIKIKQESVLPLPLLLSDRIQICWVNGGEEEEHTHLYRQNTANSDWKNEHLSYKPLYADDICRLIRDHMLSQRLIYKQKGDVGPNIPSLCSFWPSQILTKPTVEFREWVGGGHLCTLVPQQQV